MAERYHEGLPEAERRTGAGRQGQAIAEGLVTAKLEPGAPRLGAGNFGNLSGKSRPP